MTAEVTPASTWSRSSRDCDGLAAIQCKFYDAETRISRDDVDRFIVASGGEQFVARYFFDTAE